MARPAKLACPRDAEGAELWGRPPAKLVRCYGCGENAEPFEEGFCWFCTHNGQREFALESKWLRAANVKRRTRTPGEST